MTELKPNHIQIDVSEFDPRKLEYVASADYPSMFEFAVAKAVGQAYLKQKDRIIPAEPTGLGAVVSVKYFMLADRITYVKAANGSCDEYDLSNTWTSSESGVSEGLTWSYIIDGAEEVKILSAGVEV